MDSGAPVAARHARVKRAIGTALALVLIGCGGGNAEAPPDAGGAGRGGGGAIGGRGGGAGGQSGAGPSGEAGGGALAGTGGGALAGTGGGAMAGTGGGAPAGTGGGAPAGTGGGALAGTGGGAMAGTGGGAMGGRGGAGALGGTGGGALAGRGGGGGIAGASAGTGGSAVAGAGGGAAGRGGAAGSLNPGAREPRVLVVDQATNRFAAYGRDGQLAHDYRSELDFGTGFTDRNAWVDWHLLSWDGPTDVPPPGLNFPPPPGLAFPLLGSRILLSAENAGTGRVKLKILTVAGTVENAFTLQGAWSGFQLTPARQYVYATIPETPTAAPVAAVLRPSDGTILWQKTISYAMFAASDSRLIFIPADRSSPVRIKNLTTGDEFAPALTQEPFKTEPNIDIFLIAGLAQRVVIQAAGFALQSRLFYSMDWQGSITRFGSASPRYTDEYIQAFSPTGDRVRWSQVANGLGGGPIEYLGAFETTFAGNITAPWDGSDDACFGRSADRTFKLADGSLQACRCSDRVCTPIATMPVLASPWTARLVTDPDRRTVMVIYDWGANSRPPNYPDIACYSAAGQLLASLPNGAVDLDDTGQIVLLRAATGSTNAGQYAIVDLASGEIHWLGTATAPTIVYE
jgi:hypothetical protein